MKLFSRKSAAPAASAKQTRKGVTCGELATAISAVCAEMGDCSTRRTLEALDFLTIDAADSDAVNLKGAAPVSLTQFDDALADVDQYGLPGDTLSPLKRVRALLATAEAQEAKAAGVPVTRAEFEAAQAANALAFRVIEEMFRDSHAGPLTVRLEVAAQSVEFESAAAGIRGLLGRIEKASHADGARQMRRAAGRLNVVGGGNGRNF
ncbi:MAG: hypothetical protein QOF32_1910 [Gammaproteobacteria bacterium]|jgi:hypothetical protein|nr:hypothetical protein [Gammaproteobacteria bacterium]